MGGSFRGLNDLLFWRGKDHRVVRGFDGLVMMRRRSNGCVIMTREETLLSRPESAVSCQCMVNSKTDRHRRFDAEIQCGNVPTDICVPVAWNPATPDAV